MADEEEAPPEAPVGEEATPPPPPPPPEPEPEPQAEPQPEEPETVQEGQPEFVKEDAKSQDKQKPKPKPEFVSKNKQTQENLELLKQKRKRVKIAEEDKKTDRIIRNCGICKDEIQFPKKECETSGAIWHYACFKCSVCWAPLNENTVKIRKKKLFCAGHSVFQEGFQPMCKVYFNSDCMCYRVVY